MSHTATGEWQSFELRMRQRRVARLLLRADVAAEAGCRQEASECLEEAERLAPGLPAIADVQRKLDAPAVAPAVSSAEVPAVVARRPASTFVLVTFTLAALVLMALWTPDATLPSEDLRALTVETPVVDSPTVTVPETSEPIPAPLPVVAPAVVRNDVEDEISPKPLPETGAEPPRESVAATVSQVSNPVATPSVSSEAPPMTSSLAASVPPGVAVPTPAPAPPPAATLAGDAAIRNTLNRYVAAYNDLDAAAVARVWPDVNRAALQRAFDALASQHVSLGECRIEFAVGAARANCAGAATWSVRIGGGTLRTEAREWTFDLDRTGDEWRIVGVHAQNK